MLLKSSEEKREREVKTEERKERTEEKRRKVK
jgi:hypothetical protein